MLGWGRGKIGQSNLGCLKGKMAKAGNRVIKSVPPSFFFSVFLRRFLQKKREAKNGREDGSGFRHMKKRGMLENSCWKVEMQESAASFT